jgi:hypothetical protein
MKRAIGSATGQYLIVALFYLGLPIQAGYLVLRIQTDLIREGGYDKPLAC